MFRFHTARIAAALSAALLVVAAPALGTPAPAANTPTQVVENFHVSLVGVMRKAEQLGYNGRYKALGPAIAKSFHLRVMTGLVAGYHWRKFTPAQRDALVGAFTRMTTATYARRFSRYGGVKFQVLSEQPDRRKSVLVKSQIVKSDGKTVVLNYKLRKLDDRWGIIDVHLTGAISEIATRRSEYSSVIRRNGLDRLLRQIDEKIKSYAAGG